MSVCYTVQGRALDSIISFGIIKVHSLAKEEAGGKARQGGKSQEEPCCFRPLVRQRLLLCVPKVPIKLLMPVILNIATRWQS